LYHYEMIVSGRMQQKLRTRATLVDAGRALMRAGAAPTVAEAAQAAGVSRATAYRYFPTQESLLVEISNIGPSTEPVESLLENLPDGDVEARLLALLERFGPIVSAEEVPMRTALRTYLDTWLRAHARGDKAVAVREGRRMRWLDKILEPARRGMSAAQYRRLRAALALTLSIDAMVVLKDVCRIESDKEALAVLRWAATAMLRAGLAEARESKAVASAKSPRLRGAR
jgi:AcrR family transcriptional regulator